MNWNGLCEIFWDDGDRDSIASQQLSPGVAVKRNNTGERPLVVFDAKAAAFNPKMLGILESMAFTVEEIEGWSEISDQRREKTVLAALRAMALTRSRSDERT